MIPAPLPPAPLLSVVVPCYNEGAVLPAFHARLAAAMARLGESWEILYVDDGSSDTTPMLIEALAETDPHVVLLGLSRNFGKEIALTAGLDHAAATGAVIVIDADLQDPPELIPELVAQWRLGFDMVYAQRRVRAGESFSRRLTAALFYRLMQLLVERVTLPRDTGDFRLISRRAVDALLTLREHHRFMKGLFSWIGFASAAVLYDRAPRAAGRTSWTYWSLWNLAIEGITGFTVVPLKIATYLGLLVALFALLFGGQLILRTLLFGNHVPGYPSLMAVVLFLGGVQLMTLGVIGEYLGRIFNETKRRPLYLVQRHTTSGRRQPDVSTMLCVPGDTGGSDMGGSNSGTGSTKDKPGGPAPQADRDLNGPGMTNGVPDGLEQGEPAARPTSDREKSEETGAPGG